MDRNNTNYNQNNNNNWGRWAGGGAIAAGVAALAGGIYWLSRGRNSDANADGITARSEPVLRSSDRQSVQRSDTSDYSNSISSYLSNLLKKISWEHEDVVPSSKIPQNPVITNLNSLLADIYVRFVQIKSDDFEIHYKVFNSIFQQLHKKMKEVDLYYNRYFSAVQFAGSHFDNLRIKKPDEFDMDIVIGLPLNIRANAQKSDIIIEPKHAGFVQLKMGVQYQKLPMRDGNEWQVNKAAYLWKDDSNYLIQEKFLIWFKSLVIRALNTFQFCGGLPFYYVDGEQYFIRTSESGPAVTLIMENRSKGFKLDVDLVPALKFPENRWPVSKSYRSIPSGCEKGMFMVVGKPNKAADNVSDIKRSWRLALHNQERELMNNSYNLRQALRLVKKLRDAQGMKKIASYYIKTLFFWEIVERNNRLFWSVNNPATLFKLMVGRLHAALVKGEIPYFWNRHNNLIYNIDKVTLKNYEMKLVPVMALLEQKENYKHVAKYLLTPQEFREYNARFLHI